MQTTNFNQSPSTKTCGDATPIVHYVTHRGKASRKRNQQACYYDEQEVKHGLDFFHQTSVSTTLSIVSGNSVTPVEPNTPKPLEQTPQSHEIVMLEQKPSDSPTKDNNSNSMLDGDFYDFFLKFIQKRKPRITIGTYRNYVSELSKMKKFRGHLVFSEITMDLMSDYEKYMLYELGNKPNTVSKTMRKVKTITRSARFQGLMEQDPFQGVQMMNEHSTREYLNWEDLAKLEQLLSKMPSDMIKKVLRPFLFACYTGLRFQDTSRLCPHHIKNGMIVLKLIKTRETVRIPLNKKALALLSKIENGRYFHLPCNGKTNLILKHIMKIAGIPKKVTFHVSRHTFATLSLNLGIPMEVVSRLLGHNDIQTTQIYTKVMDTTRVEMMRRWDDQSFN